MMLCWWQVSSMRDLLAMVTSFSLLSLYLTYHLGFPARHYKTVVSHQNDPSMSRWHSSPVFHSPQMQQLLNNLEERQMVAQQTQIALIRGHLSVPHHELVLYSRVLQEHGFTVHIANITSLEADTWALLVCFSSLDEDAECLTRREQLSLKPHQRVSTISGLGQVLWRRPSLCRTATQLSTLPALGAFPLSPTCFALPQQYEEFLNYADGPGFNRSWLLKSSIPGVKPEHISSMEFFNRVRLKEFSDSEESLVQQFVPNQLHVFGVPVSVELFVLITSVAPLRLYVYNEGLVTFRYDDNRNYKKMHRKWWLVSQLWRQVAATHGTSAVKLALDNTDVLLVHLLLGAEAFLLLHLANLPSVKNSEFNSANHQRYRCEHCFQLLSVELVYNTSFYPVILEVNHRLVLGGGHLESHSSTQTQDSLAEALLADTLKLLFSHHPVHNDVSEALQATQDSHNIGVTGLDCVISHELCLTHDDLDWLLSTRREALNSGSYRRLYPSTSGSRYSSYLQQLQRLMLQDPHNTLQLENFLLREAFRHTTSDMHDLLTHIESVFSSQDVPAEDYSYHHETKVNYPSFNLQSVQVNSETSEKTLSQHGGNCSEDSTTSAYLKSLELVPSVGLNPPFIPLWTDYQAKVPYHLTMVRITATPLHCRVQTRFEHRLGPLHSLNTTLGLGLNRITILLQDRDTGAIVNSYYLSLQRVPAALGEPRFDPSSSHVVCSLTQECDYRISPTEPCGLHHERATWPDTLRQIERLPACTQGDAHGRWLVPCGSCSRRDTCTWSLLRWQPYTCTHHVVDRLQLASCLQNKKLLFVGDSTNRGMMHYMMERLNGSLAACDKTHHIRVYSNLNHGQTTLSFAYYPQFWLTAPQRPVFDKTLYQLLLKSQPLQNTSDTVLIVGGVHWLATQHLHTLLRVLKREGLHGARVVVKTLGSGFHIPAEGVHYLSKTQQDKLLRHSMGLAAFAKHHRMIVVDTFNMTAARYKDFLQGKCACHFHKLEERTDLGSGYHVEGPINAIYTDILLSRLCQDSTPLPSNAGARNTDEYSRG